MKVRASDLFDFPLALLDPEIGHWSFAVIKIWKADRHVQAEFGDVLLFFDWAFDTAEKLIRSAEGF